MVATPATLFAAADYGLSDAAGQAPDLIKPGVNEVTPAVAAQIVGNILRPFLALTGFVLFVLILYAGVLWFTSAGDSSKVEHAQKIFSSSAVGLAIILGAFLITTFILTLVRDSVNDVTQ